LSTSPDSLRAAVEALLSGGVVVFPTETFYGIGCRAKDEAAAARIVAAKGRGPGSPFPVIAADRAQAETLWIGVPAAAARLIAAFWPGPVTIVLPAAPGLPPQIAGSGEVGVRVSPHPIAAELARLAGPIVATSANLAGGSEVTAVAQIDPSIAGAADVVIDGGPTAGGRPSTVVAFRDREVVVLREGAIEVDRVLSVARG
jgi:L-threonylcarbamoyladenylate synthase